ncbi:hypothetical protein BGZ67_010303, partial [Mortierella alpina]
MAVSGTQLSVAGIVQLVSWGITSITVLRCPNVSAVDLAQALVRVVKKLDHVNVAVVTHLKTKDQAGTLRAMTHKYRDRLRILM